MHLDMIIICVSFALLIWIGYSRRALKNFVVDFKKFPVKWQARVAGLIGIAFVPAMVILWILYPENTNAAIWIWIAQLFCEAIYIVIMVLISYRFTQTGTLLEHLHGIRATKDSDPVELQKQLQKWCSVKYSLRKIKKALQIMTDNDTETQQIPIYYSPISSKKEEKGENKQ